MDPTAIPRSIARLQYAAVRLPLAVVDECVAAGQRGEGAFARRGLELSLGSLDRFAGWLLADEQISRRGQALLRQTGHPAAAGAPETTAPVRPARDLRVVPARPAGARQAGGQDRDMGGMIAADQDQEDKRHVRGAAGGRVMTGNNHAAAGGAPARQAADRAGEQPGRGGTVDVRFTLPAEVQAGTVALCGEFNNWSAHDIRLERGGDGCWQATVALEPGRSYRYRYLLDGERWENAWQADRYVPNPYGGTDSVVVVE
jgi:Carbohydrate-binding module 48 (Isoamylase N-terminal domain)